MAAVPAEEPAKLFPIQLRRTDVGEIIYTCGGFSVRTVNPITEYAIETGFSALEPTSKSFQVSLKFSATNKPEESGFALPYHLAVTVHADFGIVGEFPMEKLEMWAKLNGTALLMPFLREAVHTITAKTGFKPYLLPMIEAPLYKVAPPRSTEYPVASVAAASS